MSTVTNDPFFEAFDEVDSVRHGLPGRAYTSGEFFELEANQLFAASWSFVGFAHQLANVGDVQPLTVAGKPVFLVRSEADKIRAFHNVCRHRNLKLIGQAGHCDALILVLIIDGLMILVDSSASPHILVVENQVCPMDLILQITDFMRFRAIHLMTGYL